jgi:hypothetical protein
LTIVDVLSRCCDHPKPGKHRLAGLGWSNFYQISNEAEVFLISKEMRTSLSRMPSSIISNRRSRRRATKI